MLAARGRPITPPSMQEPPVSTIKTLLREVSSLSQGYRRATLGQHLKIQGGHHDLFDPNTVVTCLR